MESYGIELILDLHDCDSATFNRKSIRKYFIQLCKLINMKREDLHFWDYEGDPEGYEKALPHLRGVSAVQFIKTSNVTIHTLDDLRKVFINIFSCKDFDCGVAMEFSKEWFKSNRLKNWKIVRRD